MKTWIYLIALTGLLTVACKKEQPESAVTSDGYFKLPEKAYDYPVSANDHVATLGRVLFYDKNLSHNNSISCGSCHQQANAFCDNQRSSVGLSGVHSTRNTPGIFNKRTRAFWDGRAKGFSELALMPAANHFEMGIKDFDELSVRLQKLPYYQTLVKKAFGDSYIDSTRLNQALAEFLNNFMFSNNKFRRSMLGTEALSATESLGKDLFFGKAGCFNCHNVQIMDPAATSPYSSGFDFSFIAFNIGLESDYADKGVSAITGETKDKGKFMIPSLMNVEYTWPYMHDGRFNTLEEVVEHYNSGIKDHPCLDIRLRDLSAFPPYTSPDEVMRQVDKNANGMLEPEESSIVPPQKLNLTASEKRQLVAFLKTLSDPGIKTDVRFASPF